MAKSVPTFEQRINKIKTERPFQAFYEILYAYRYTNFEKEPRHLIEEYLGLVEQHLKKKMEAFRAITEENWYTTPSSDIIKLANIHHDLSARFPTGNSDPGIGHRHVMDLVEESLCNAVRREGYHIDMEGFENLFRILERGKARFDQKQHALSLLLANAGRQPGVGFIPRLQLWTDKAREYGIGDFSPAATLFAKQMQSYCDKRDTAPVGPDLLKLASALLEKTPPGSAESKKTLLSLYRMAAAELQSAHGYSQLHTLNAVNLAATAISFEADKGTIPSSGSHTNGVVATQEVLFVSGRVGTKGRPEIFYAFPASTVILNNVIEPGAAIVYRDYEPMGPLDACARIFATSERYTQAGIGRNYYETLVRDLRDGSGHIARAKAPMLRELIDRRIAKLRAALKPLERAPG